MSAITIDNPLTRAGTVCPLCHGDKSHGLVACWPCFRNHGMRYGNRDAEDTIRAFETELRGYGNGRD